MRSLLLSLFAALALLSWLPPLSAQTSSSASDDPAVVAAVAPVFPPIARAAHANGDVIVEVTIADDGRVGRTKVISGPVLLQKGSEAAAKKWKFVASDVRARTTRLTFNFAYVDGRDSDPEYAITFMPPYKVQVAWNRPAPGY
jgi:TonB family protein